MLEILITSLYKILEKKLYIKSLHLKKCYKSEDFRERIVGIILNSKFFEN